MGTAPAVFNERRYDAFLSHAHRDKVAAVDAIYQWTKLAGLKVWYDSADLAPGAGFGEALGEAILDCRGGILVLSEESMTRGWVKKEWEVFSRQQNNNPDFQIIPIRIDGVQPPEMISIQKWIEMPSQKLGAAEAGQIIQAVHRYYRTSDAIEGRRVYLSSGGRPREQEFSQKVKQRIGKLPTRTWIVRDVPRPDYDRVRVGELVEASHAVVAVASLRQGSATSPFIADEINAAISRKVPIFVIREHGVVPTWPEEGVESWEIANLQDANDAELEDRINDFFEAPKPPPKEAFCFLGHAIEPQKQAVWDHVHRAMQAVTGLKCYDGDRLRGESAPHEIATRIREATFCIFDISPKEDGQPALNTCIEAGIRIGANKPFGLICRGERTTPPFMFRTKQVEYFTDDAEMIAHIRHLCVPYQRLLE